MQLIIDPENIEKISHSIINQLQTVLYDDLKKSIINHEERISEQENSLKSFLESDLPKNIYFQFIKVSSSPINKIINPENYVINLLKTRFNFVDVYRTYRIRDHSSLLDQCKPLNFFNENNRNPGLPDLIVYLNKNDIYKKTFFFVEVKNIDDGIRMEQIRWAINHPEVKVIFMFLEYEVVE
jgi:hypothetical protein